MSDWTDELKEEVVAAYLEREPTPENTMDIVKELAEEYDGKTPNSIRMILSKAGVYVKKTPAASGGSSSSGSTGGSKRVNKAEAIANLKTAIADAGQEVDGDIVDRLTGKAALYFTEILNASK